ncbi:MAG: DNA adenine methylase [Spirochaetota bacterium]
MDALLPRSLTSDLISYIGNKRRILPYLADVLAPLVEASEKTTFLDPFCGSGVVSRLARHLGCTVAANDWEPYAHAVTVPYLENRPADLPGLFAPFGGVSAVYDRLNACREPSTRYISLHYAPEDTERPRLGAERLFYTTENARIIDAVRDEIDRLAPNGRDVECGRVRRILLSSLLQQASVHANTSGVFKAYHRGFGGLGRDALGRIMRPIRLDPPMIPDGPVGGASCVDAGEFVSSRPADVCYLDPPYASHQYGSNYFMLNTILRWDRPPVDERRDERGMLLSKAGIRPDWTDTRSPFCSRRGAPRAIRDLLDKIDARFIVVSYSTDGIVALEELAEMLAERGALDVRSIDYTTYRGGKQSMTRSRSNGEFVFVADTSRRADSRGTSVLPVAVAASIARSRRRAIEDKRFNPERMAESFDCRPGYVVLSDGWFAETTDRYEIAIPDPPGDLAPGDLDRVELLLARAACRDHMEELEIVLSLAWSQADSRRYLRRAVSCLRQFAHRKYREQFNEALTLVRRAMVARPRVYGSISKAVAELEERARMRRARDR